MSPVANPASEYFKDGSWGWDSTAWRKLPLITGYSDQWAEDFGWPVEADGPWVGWTALVPPGYIYVLQCASVCNTSGNRGERYVYFVHGAAFCKVVHTALPVKDMPDIWRGKILLGERDYVYMTHEDCLAGDVIEAAVWGYKMRV